MRAYLIDPRANAIDCVEYNGRIEDLFRLIEVDCINAVTFNEAGDGVYISDVALWDWHNRARPDEFFFVRGYDNPLIGKGLVTGVLPEGQEAEPTVSLGWLWRNVRFVWPREIGGQIRWVDRQPLTA